jgi:hypothetical protein
MKAGGTTSFVVELFSFLQLQSYATLRLLELPVIHPGFLEILVCLVDNVDGNYDYNDSDGSDIFNGDVIRCVLVCDASCSCRWLSAIRRNVYPPYMNTEK